MTRLIRTTGLLLLTAAAINTAVAWVCAIWIPNPTATSIRKLDAPPITGAPDTWGVPVVSEAAVRPGFAVYQESWALVLFEGQPDLITPQEAMVLRRSDDVPIGARSETLLVTTQSSFAGLPLRCLTWRTCEVPIDLEMPPDFRPPFTPLDRGLGGFNNFLGYVILAQRDRRLPVVPIAPAFAINTAFYAAALGGLLFALPAARRSVRRSRGLCPYCTYPIGIAPDCTECGRPVGAPPVPAPEESRA